MEKALDELERLLYNIVKRRFYNVALCPMWPLPGGRNMEKIRFIMNKHKEVSPKKVVSFEEYCHCMDFEQAEEVIPPDFARRVRRHTLRRRLEVFCLFLEAGLCLSLLLFLLVSALRFFSR